MMSSSTPQMRGYDMFLYMDPFDLMMTQARTGPRIAELACADRLLWYEGLGCIKTPMQQSR